MSKFEVAMVGDTPDELPSIDRGAIFSAILARQALRIEAKLPRLDVGFEYNKAVEQALHRVEEVRWQRHAELHHDRVRGEILARQRRKHGPAWPSGWSGRMVLSILVQRELEASFSRS
ncbi:hypothetical protein [Methylobacterium longum]|uniref:Uncharacterized protein n=1 Tax=Methylobacterium longum TaxID=767694 RepID=A0ABT8AR69_9HYPH|nr:hypothetical protein [Methylobacterium longum]MDN3572343.1 hypothetical protein [Methylobacterium longum]